MEEPQCNEFFLEEDDYNYNEDNSRNREKRKRSTDSSIASQNNPTLTLSAPSQQHPVTPTTTTPALSKETKELPKTSLADTVKPEAKPEKVERTEVKRPRLTSPNSSKNIVENPRPSGNKEVSRRRRTRSRSPRQDLRDSRRRRNREARRKSAERLSKTGHLDVKDGRSLGSSRSSLCIMDSTVTDRRREPNLSRGTQGESQNSSRVRTRSGLSGDRDQDRDRRRVGSPPTVPSIQRTKEAISSQDSEVALEANRIRNQLQGNNASTQSNGSRHRNNDVCTASLRWNRRDRLPDITLMDDSAPPPTGPAADRKRHAPDLHSPDAANSSSAFSSMSVARRAERAQHNDTLRDRRADPGAHDLRDRRGNADKKSISNNAATARNPSIGGPSTNSDQFTSSDHRNSASHSKVPNRGAREEADKASVSMDTTKRTGSDDGSRSKVRNGQISGTPLVDQAVLFKNRATSSSNSVASRPRVSLTTGTTEGQQSKWKPVESGPKDQGTRPIPTNRDGVPIQGRNFPMSSPYPADPIPASQSSESDRRNHVINMDYVAPEHPHLSLPGYPTQPGPGAGSSDYSLVDGGIADAQGNGAAPMMNRMGRSMMEPVESMDAVNSMQMGGVDMRSYPPVGMMADMGAGMPDLAMMNGMMNNWNPAEIEYYNAYLQNDPNAMMMMMMMNAYQFDGSEMNANFTPKDHYNVVGNFGAAANTPTAMAQDRLSRGHHRTSYPTASTASDAFNAHEGGGSNFRHKTVSPPSTIDTSNKFSPIIDGNNSSTFADTKAEDGNGSVHRNIPSSSITTADPVIPRNNQPHNPLPTASSDPSRPLDGDQEQDGNQPPLSRPPNPRPPQPPSKRHNHKKKSRDANVPLMRFAGPPQFFAPNFDHLFDPTVMVSSSPHVSSVPSSATLAPHHHHPQHHSHLQFLPFAQYPLVYPNLQLHPQQQQQQQPQQFHHPHRRAGLQ